MVESMCSVLLPKKLVDTEPGLVAALKTQSETLQNINMAFLNIQNRFHLAFFHEALKTDFGTTQGYVSLPPSSPSLGPSRERLLTGATGGRPNLGRSPRRWRSWGD
jgi:hypothetical protein